MLTLAVALAAALTVVPQDCDLERPSGRGGCTRGAVDRLPMTALQAVGTHNSYKLAIAPAEMALLRARNPAAADSLDYAHPPLAEQLDAGARQLEIDLLHDPETGRYADPVGLKLAGAAAQPYDLAPLQRPGLKVLHAQDVDYRSNCPLFVDCLGQVRAWSQAHPQHAPILILLNLKEGPIAGLPGSVEAARFDDAAMDAIDREIRGVFGAGSFITPDGVRGVRPTLREAVAAGGWPTLGAARGKVLFALDAPKGQVERYRRGSLTGRLLFVNVEESDPDAAYITLNEPVAQQGRIRAAVAAGLLVRTRADADTKEARSGETARREAAFASGAQYVSTDYMWPDPRLGPYRVQLPGGGVARLSPVAR